MLTPVADECNSLVPIEWPAFLAPTSPQLVSGLHQIKKRGKHRLRVVDGIDGDLREVIEPASKQLDRPLTKLNQSRFFDKFQSSRITDQFRHSQRSMPVATPHGALDARFVNGRTPPPHHPMMSRAIVDSTPLWEHPFINVHEVNR